VDRLDAMRVLLAVVDEGSLSAGSRKLRIPLPSVSRKVAELERHLGTRLLIRTSRNVQPTDAGRDYIDAARQIVEQLRDAELRASGEYEIPRGELRITATIEVARRILVPIASQFLREYPEISLDVFSTNRFVDLKEERIDVAVRFGSLPSSSLFGTNVGSVRTVTCASPDYLKRRGKPTTLDDLAGHDVIQLFNLSWTQADGSPMPPHLWSTRVHANDASVATAMAVNGLGITQAPDFMIADELESGTLVEMLADYAPEPVPAHLIYVKQGLLPLKVRAFIDWMAPKLRAKLGQPPG
jgi:DNA-binding transcriptional LysR family regulator